MRKKKDIPANTGNFVRTQIDSTDFKNENLTAKKKKNETEKQCFFKKISEKILKQRKLSNKISTSKKIGRRNKSNKIAKNCCLSRYKRSRQNKINYMFVPSKIQTKNNKQNKI